MKRTTKTLQYIIGISCFATGILFFLFAMAYMPDLIILPIVLIIAGVISLAFIPFKKK